LGADLLLLPRQLALLRLRLLLLLLQGLCAWLAC
jgi:hypothetical protein